MENIGTVKVITKPVTRVIVNGKDIEVPGGTTDFNASDLLDFSKHEAYSYRVVGDTMIAVSVPEKKGYDPETGIDTYSTGELDWDTAERCLEYAVADLKVAS